MRPGGIGQAPQAAFGEHRHHVFGAPHVPGVSVVRSAVRQLRTARAAPALPPGRRRPTALPVGSEEQPEWQRRGRACRGAAGTKGTSSSWLCIQLQRH